MSQFKYQLKSAISILINSKGFPVFSRAILQQTLKQMAHFRKCLGGACKAFIMLFILKPAADLLPASWAYSLANFFAFC